jgi:hypothetical protein
MFATGIILATICGGIFGIYQGIRSAIARHKKIREIEQAQSAEWVRAPVEDKE